MKSQSVSLLLAVTALVLLAACVPPVEVPAEAPLAGADAPAVPVSPTLSAATLTPLPPAPTPLPPTSTPVPTSPTPAGPTPTPMAFNVVKDVPYTSRRTLDVYAPTVPGPWPVVVGLHGGGVNAAQLASLSQAVAGRGAVVFAPNWRSRESSLLDSVTGGWEDAACAVRFARAKATDYGGDPSKILVVGHSAGGASGAVAALAGDDFAGDCLVSEGSALADGFVGLDGAYSILDYIQKWIFEKYPAEEWAKINPYAYVERAPIRGDVEFHLFTGFEEELDADALKFQQALQAAGYQVAYTRLPGVDHMSMASGQREETVSDIADLAHRLAPAPEMTITFVEDGCTYDGPEQVPMGEIKVALVAAADTFYVYAAVAGTLDPDKSIDDLKAWQSVDQPDWLEVFGFEEVLPNERAILTLDAPPGPLYFVCFGAHPERKIGALGPVEVLH